MKFDLIIVGGGVVGASLALALQHSGLQIALIEAKLPSLNDPRLFALNATSCQLLENLSLWQDIQAYAARIDQVHVSRRGRFGVTNLRAEDIDLPTLGHVIPAYRIEQALNKRLANSSVTVFCPATVISLKSYDDYAEIEVVNDNKSNYLTAALIIAADGADSSMRKLAGIEIENYDYQQNALVTITDLTRMHSAIAYERFTEDGAIAMLPLPGKQMATIWTASHAFISNLLTLKAEDFTKRLQQDFGYRLGKLSAPHKRHCYPLHATKILFNNHRQLYFLGNAAHALHPIAAQGFNLALYEVAWLHQHINNILANGDALSARLLNDLSKEINTQQKFTMQFSHQLAELFKSPKLWRNQLIQLGFTGLDLLPPAKRYLLNRLLGRNRQLPKLLTGSMHDEISHYRN